MNKIKKITALALALLLLMGSSPIAQVAEATAETQVSTTIEEPLETTIEPMVPEDSAEKPAENTVPDENTEKTTENTVPDENTDLSYDELIAEAYRLAAVDGQEPAMLPTGYIKELYAEMVGDTIDSPALYATMRPVSNKNLPVPRTYYNLFWKNPNSGNSWQKWNGSWWIEKFDYFELSTGQTGYCIEPFNSDPAIGSDRIPMRWDDIHVKWASAGGSFEQEKQRGIALALAYGAPNNGDTSDEGKWATAALVWDMACGYRNPNGTLRFSPSPFETVLRNNRPEVYAKFTAIVDALKNYKVIPSFSAKTPGRIDANSTHTLQRQADGNYSVTLHDTNGVLEHFNYTSNIPGLSFSKNGNDVTITATPAAAEQISTGSTINNRGHEVAVDPEQVCTVWRTSGNAQLIACLDSALDPTPSYFKLTAKEPKGRIVVTKITNTGNNRADWTFDVFADTQCTDLVDTLSVSDVDGWGFSGELDPGTYYVREREAHESADQYPYWTLDTSVMRYEVEADKDTWPHRDQMFFNDHQGRIHVQKTVNTGTYWRDGFIFDIYNDAGELVETLTTDTNGDAYSSLLSRGTYTVVERQSGNYWDCDTSEHTVVVRPGETTTETWYNRLMGQIEVHKVAINGSAAGWNFEIYDSADKLVERLTTGADGTARSNYLLPGQYTVRELHDRGDFWEYDVNVEQDVVVYPRVDSPSIVEYTNTQLGKIAIKKAMATDGPLDGWNFKITDSAGKEIPGSPFITAEDGTITTGNLAPGQYTVEELLPDDSPYYCKGENPQTITVTAGSTAEVSFTNAPRPGKISIMKVDPAGQPLAGAKFMLEWSHDNGVTWTPVHYSSSEDVTLGGCNNPLLTDGCLVSDDTGLVEFCNLYPTLMYRLTEVEAPEGQQLLAGTAWQGTLPLDTLTIALTIYNGQGFILPATGSHGKVVYIAGGVLLITSAIILICYERKKKK